MFSTKYKSLAADILDNPDKYKVDPVEKLARTIDKMEDNKRKQMAQAERSIQGESKEGNRGYGEGRRMGD